MIRDKQKKVCKKYQYSKFSLHNIIVSKQRSLERAAFFFYQLFLFHTNTNCGRRGRNCLMIWKTCSINLCRDRRVKQETAWKKKADKGFVCKYTPISSAIYYILSVQIYDYLATGEQSEPIERKRERVRPFL